MSPDNVSLYSNTSDIGLPPKSFSSAHPKAYRLCNAFLLLPKSKSTARYCGSNMYCVICTSTVCKHFIGTNVILVTLCGIYLYLVQMKKSKAGQWWLSKLPETTKLNLHSSSLGQHRMSTTRVPLFKEIKCPTSSLIPKGSADHALLPTSTPLSEV